MKLLFSLILVYTFLPLNSFSADSSKHTNDSVVQQLRSNQDLNLQIKKICESFIPQLIEGERTRLAVMDFTSSYPTISVLGNYIRQSIVAELQKSPHEFEIIDQLLVLQDLREQHVPIGSALDSASISSLTDKPLFADAVIMGNIKIQPPSIFLDASLYDDISLISFIRYTLPFNPVLETTSHATTTEYPLEFLTPEKPKKKESKIEMYTEKMIEKLGKMKPIWIYLIVAFIAFIENIFPPFPSDAVVIFGGTISGIGGKVSYWILLLSTTIGSTLGFMLAYYIGVKCSATKLSQLKMRFVPIDALVKVGAWFAKYGYVLIIVNRFLAGTRAVVSFFAGLSGLPFVLTTVLSFVSALAWNALLLYLGSLFGKNWDLALSYIGRYSSAMFYILIGVLAVWLVVYLIKLNRKIAREEKSAKQETTDSPEEQLTSPHRVP
ncbi:MAG: DedA family protein [Ignavibacteriales bacterium]|nr:DedA family protein [Ignavibacteriales bacterium]